MAIGTSPGGYINTGTEWDIQLLQNNDDTITFQFSNNAVPFNLTGYTFTMYLKANAQASDASAFSNSPVISAPLLGQVVVSFPAAQLDAATDSSSPLFYHVDGFQSSVFPFTTTFVFGTVTVLPI